MKDKMEPFSILLSLTDPEYDKGYDLDKMASEDSKLINKLLKLANDNGLRYHLCSGLSREGIRSQQVEKILDKERYRLEKYLNTLDLLNNISGNDQIDYILIKSYNRIPHIPRDIDIFIRTRQRDRLFDIFRRNNMRCVQGGPAETSFESEKYLRIDLYTDIIYMSIPFLEGDYLWGSQKDIDIFGRSVKGLSQDADLLLILVHNIIAHGKLTLLDLLHIRQISKEADISECRRYAERQGWGAFFDLALSRISGISRAIYIDKTEVQFPYLFEREFLKRCIYSIEGMDLTAFQKFFLGLSLLQDKMIHRSKGTILYRALRSSDILRNIFNSLTAGVKRYRGDNKSRS
jgi:hypothetical protein